MLTKETKTALSERKRALQELEENAEKAGGLAAEVASLRQDVARIEERKAKFAALGKGHVEIPQKSVDPRYKVEIEWQPIRSRLTGDELAVIEEKNLEHLRGAIAEREQEIERLLAE